jgi:hypothetical protein
VPASLLYPVIKPWPFRGWGLDFIREVHSSSSKGHRFILVATDYFMKWTEVVPLRGMTHRELISFVLEHIIHRFGIPQTLTTDQGPAFMSQQFREFARSLKIKLLNSSPYYAQANWQAEASNKLLISLIKKKIEDSPRRWHKVLRCCGLTELPNMGLPKSRCLNSYIARKLCCPWSLICRPAG